MFSRQFIFGIIAPALMLFWAAAMAYSAFAGSSGYGALAALEKDVEEKAADVDALRAHRLELEQRADQLNSKSLDPDLIDERIRSVLGYSREGDKVVSRRVLRDAAAQAGK